MYRKACVLAGLVSVAMTTPAVAGTITTLEVIEANGGITLDAAGDIYAANYGPVNATSGSRNVWRISPSGAFDPVVFAMGINIASGNDFDSMGNLFQSNFGGNEISKIDAAGIVTSFSTAVNGPIGIAIDDADNVFVSNCRGDRISRIEPDGTASTFSTSSRYDCPNGLTRHDSGDLYVINWNDGQILRITPAAEVSLFATVPSPGGHVTIAGDRLYATSFGSHQVFEFQLTGAVAGTLLATIGTGVAGSADGSYATASFDRPNGITADATGDILYLTDATGVRRIELEDEVGTPPPQPAPAPTPTPSPPSGGGGGGSAGWLLLLCGLPAIWRRSRFGRR